MQTARILIALSLAAAGAIPASARAQQGPSGRPPAEITQDILKLGAACRESGGKPGRSPGMIQIADLTGDGIVDYVLDLNTYNCEGGSPAPGAGQKGGSGQNGAAIAIYIGLPAGGARKVFDAVAFSAKVRGAPRQRVWLDLQGVDCGQQNAASLSMAAQLACSRPLNWSPASGAFVYAPLREAQPYGPRPRGLAA